MNLAAMLTSVEKSTSPRPPEIGIQDLWEPTKIIQAMQVRTHLNTSTIMLDILMSYGEPRVTFLSARFTAILSDQELELFGTTGQYCVKCTGSVGTDHDVLIGENEGVLLTH